MKIPKKIQLANIPTPLQRIQFNGTSFYIKRDDLTGVELSGNKVRKLEYLLYEAKKRKVDYVFTTGGEQSNHARATAIAASSCGIKSKLFLWGIPKKNIDGNLFLSKLVDAQIKYLNKEEFFRAYEIMEIERRKFEKRGKRVFVIPEGGSSALGIWGYVNFINELKTQVDLRKMKGILTAAGSGGTSAGLIIGAALNGFKLKIFAVNVLCDKETIRNRIVSYIDAFKNEFKVKDKIDFSNLEILDGYSKEGYKHISQDKLKVIKNFASSSGMILDPAYTGKAFYAFNENFLGSKKSTNVMFVHTGGLFGVFPKRQNYLSV